MRRTLLHVVNGLLLVLFAVAAAVQYNDPDPVTWMAIYGAGALCCALFLVGRLPWALSALVSAGCLLGALVLLAQIVFGPFPFFDETGREMMGLMEETREMFGFLITALWTGFLAWQVRRSPKRAPASPEASP